MEDRKEVNYPGECIHDLNIINKTYLDDLNLLITFQV